LLAVLGVFPCRQAVNVNLLRKRFYVPSEDQWVTLRISAAALKTINKKGIEAVLSEARANGQVAI